MRPITGSFARAAMVAAALIVAAGCTPTSKSSRDDKTLHLPQAVVTGSAFAGSTLSGPLSRQVDESAWSDPWQVQADVTALRTLPGDGFQPVGLLARLIYALPASSVLRPSSQLAYQGQYRFAASEDDIAPLRGPAEDQAAIGSLDSALVAGTTVGLKIAPNGESVAGELIHIQVFRADDATYELSILKSAGEVSETIVIARPMESDAERVWLTIPLVFENSNAAGVLVDLRVNRDAGASADAVARAKTQVDESVQRISNRARPVNADEQLTHAALTALVDAGDTPRAALVYLANQTDARLAEAVALVADDSLLAIVARLVREKAANLSAYDRATVGWMVERSAIEAVVSIKEDETNPALPAVLGVLQTYAGEAGRQLDVLQSLANDSGNVRDLQNRLLAEHLIYLEDNSPAARVRAYDWLTSRDAAPANYDPLADVRDRREALDAFREAAAQPK